MIKQVITIQLIITLTASIVLWLTVGESVSRSYFWSSFSIILPNLLVVFLSLWIKNNQVIFWSGALVNKFISAILLASSIKFLKDPSWIAFVIGIVITVYIPVLVVSMGRKHLKHDM